MHDLPAQVAQASPAISNHGKFSPSVYSNASQYSAGKSNLASLNSFSFASTPTLSTLNPSKSSADLRKQSKKPLTNQKPSNFYISSASRSNSLPVPHMARSVHRAKSSPSLATQEGKKHSTNPPPIPCNIEFKERKVASPIPRNLFDHRFSNASSTTTTTTTTISTYSDRSSSSSNTLYPISQKALFGRSIPPIEVEPPVKDSSSIKESTYAHSYADSYSSQQISAIDIINDYTDDLSRSSSAVYSNYDENISQIQSTNGSSAASKPKSPVVKPTGPTNPITLRPVLSRRTLISQSDPARDRYGFKKQTSQITESQYNKWWVVYKPYIERRKKKWIRLMKDSGLSTEKDDPVKFPAKSDKVKRYIRKGIPSEWRGNAWFFYARGNEKLASNKGLYDNLCKQAENLETPDAEIIERDLHRTFPDNIHFRSDSASDGGRSRETEAPMITSLRKVLRSFSIYQPKIGYCQSLNFLAGLLLLFLNEEKSFWMLVIITERYLPGAHEISLEGVNVDQGVLMLCVKESLPKLWNKIGVNFEGEHYNSVLTKLPPITLCTAAWFMSGYIGILPIETVLRVWDCLFYEDSKTFFRIALTIFKIAEPEIERLGDSMEIFQMIQTLPKGFLDASALMTACFKRRNGFRHVSQEEILQLRKFVRERRQLALQATKRESDWEDKSHNLDDEGSTSNSGIQKQQPSSSQQPVKDVESSFESNDLEEYNHFKHGPKPNYFGLSRRMKSLKKASRNG